MQVSSYLKKIDFNKFRLFYRKNKNFETYILDKGDKSDWLRFSDEQSLDNSIIDFNGKINTSFNEVSSSNEVQRLQELFHPGSIRIYPNKKYSAYDTAIILEKNNQIVGGLNIDLKNRTARTITDEILALSHEEIDSLFKIFELFEVKIYDHYLPPSLATYSYWMNYEFPFDFFFNPAFSIFETRINTGLMCVNFIHARLVIEPINEGVKKEQILRVQSLEDQRYKLNKTLIERFWELYQTQKNDYGLPDLTNQEQLYYFVKTSTISVPQNNEEPIGIYFRTWDEEHGQTVYYKDNELEFE
jgi:hypothetical protein